MPLQRYMMLCLNHATLGYYTRGDVFGKKGDFITSPEISQVFEEVSIIKSDSVVDPSRDVADRLCLSSDSFSGSICSLDGKRMDRLARSEYWSSAQVEGRSWPT